MQVDWLFMQVVISMHHYLVLGAVVIEIRVLCGYIRVLLSWCVIRVHYRGSDVL